MMMEKIELTEDMIRVLCTACNRNEAGQHFTEWLDYETLEALGLLEIYRPVHSATGIAYDQSQWSLGITDEGLEVVDAHPELHPQ
jgi:hypothetical protein